MTVAHVSEPPLTGWRFAVDTCRRRPNLNFVVPFIVSNLGVISGARTAGA